MNFTRSTDKNPLSQFVLPLMFKVWAPLVDLVLQQALMDAMDDLFPRVEIDGLLKGTSILADAKSDQWKTKKS